MISIGKLALVFLVAGLPLLVHSDPTPTPPAGFQYLFNCGNVNGNVILANDLTAATGDCLRVMTNGATIDGNGFRISAPGGKAVNILDHDHTTIVNLVSDAGVQIYGSAAHHTTIRASTLGSIGIYYGADDTVIQNNRFTSLYALSEAPYTDPIQRITLVDNHLESANNKIVWIQSGVGKSSQNPQTYPCLAGNHLIENNTFVSHFTGSASSEPAIFTLRCSGGDTIRNNVLEADGTATGIYLRDEANNSLYENNSVWTSSSASSGAILMGSGWSVYGQPSYNVFRNNTFHAAGSRTLFFEGIGLENRFERNVFYAGSFEGNRIHGGGGNVFDHNTFFNAQPGNAMVFDRLAPPANVFSSNIFDADNSSGKRFFEFDHAPDFAGYVARNNLFFNRNGAALFQDPSNILNVWTLPQWMAQTGETGSLEGDPQFTDASSFNFNLGSGSAARGLGEGGSDAGAFPYSDSTPQSPPSDTPTPTPVSPPAPAGGNSNSGGGGGSAVNPLLPTPIPTFFVPTPVVYEEPVLPQRVPTPLVFHELTDNQVEQAALDLPADQPESVQVQQIVSQARKLESQGKMEEAREMWDRARFKLNTILLSVRRAQTSHYWYIPLGVLALIIGLALFLAIHPHHPPYDPPILIKPESFLQDGV